MTGVLVGALLGAGLFLIWWSSWPQEETPARGPRENRVLQRLRDELAQADYRGIGPVALLVACFITFLLVLVTILAIATSTVTLWRYLRV